VRPRAAVDPDRRAVVTIRCHPQAPVASGDLEAWLENALERVRDELASPTSVRLFRVSQRLPSGRDLAGWLVEIDSREARLATGLDLDALIRDMRLLGLQPTLFGALGPAGKTNAL
jgi:hypothetical protein